MQNSYERDSEAHELHDVQIEEIENIRHEGDTNDIRGNVANIVTQGNLSPRSSQNFITS